MSPNRLVLIDGNSLLYRSFYAIRQLSTSDGFPTNAIYGFLTTLRKIVGEEIPSYLAVVFDTKGPTVRHEAYKDYKAHRKPMPEDLVRQIPKLKEVLAALRIPVREFEGYEADDVLGTLAVQAARDKIPTIIVTTDKDLLQLVGPAVSVYNPSKDVLLDEAGVRRFFGAPPGRVVDVLALWGDPSDNVPGVPGVGEKTAKRLIEEHGSLDGLLKDLDRLGNPKLKARIEAGLDLLKLSRGLVTIKTDLDVPLDLDQFAVTGPDLPTLLRLFRELEFTSLAAEYGRALRPERKTSYAAVLDRKALAALVTRIRDAGAVSLDTETDSPDPTQARLVGISFALKPDEAFYLPLGHDYPGAPAQIAKPDALDVLRGVIEDPAVLKTGQNIKYDTIVLAGEGLALEGIEYDTMVLSYLLEPNWGKHNLERLASHYLQEQKTPYAAVAGKGKSAVTMDKVPVEAVTAYSCQDADFALRLRDVLWPLIEAKKLDRLYREIEKPLIRVLADMESTGVKVDGRALRALSKELGRDLDALTAQIHELAGVDFNIHSPQQLAEILFSKLNLPASRKTKATKSFSTSMETLQELAPLHPLVGKVLEYRQLSKLKSTYADALMELVNPKTGRIHTSYNQTVASTGRLSSSEPNLQNIPIRGEMGKRFRQAFIADNGSSLLAADYSQIELRVLAHLSRDPALVETFLKDRDIHAETARRVFGDEAAFFPDELRRRAKVINFSIVYGAGAYSMARELGTTPAEAQKFIDRYFQEYPGVRDFLEGLVREATERGYAETLFGRQRPVPELRQDNKVAQQAGRRIALNTPIQGTAADLMKKAMVEIWRALREKKLRTRMILQVHDELVFEVPNGERAAVETLVRDKLENVLPLAVPLKVHLGWGAHWDEAK
jgi:DNA polymerase-1